MNESAGTDTLFNSPSQAFGFKAHSGQNVKNAVRLFSAYQFCLN
jgi:hypothetical protein